MVRRGEGDEFVDLLVPAELGDVVVRQWAATLGPPDEVDLLGSGGCEDAVDEAGDGLGGDSDVTGVGEVRQQLQPVEVRGEDAVPGLGELRGVHRPGCVGVGVRAGQQDDGVMPLTRFAAEVVGSLGIGTRVGQGVDGGRVGEQLAGSVASRRNAIRAPGHGDLGWNRGIGFDGMCRGSRNGREGSGHDGGQGGQDCCELF